MNDFLDELAFIDGTRFPYKGFKTLTEYVQRISLEYGVPFAAYLTTQNIFRSKISHVVMILLHFYKKKAWNKISKEKD